MAREQPRLEVTSLFPTPFMRAPGLLEARVVRELVSHLSTSRVQANAKSEQLSHTEVVAPETCPAYRGVCALVTPALVELGVLLFGERLGWTVKEMWMNELAHGGRQALHAHANSFISGVVYLSDCHPSARTVFYRGLGGRDFTFANESDAAQRGPYNSPRWVTPPVAPGDLILFPSYMLHEVPQNHGGRRITLAFNAIPDRLRSWGYEVRLK